MKAVFAWILLLSVGMIGADALRQKIVSDSNTPEPNIYREKIGGTGTIDYHLYSLNEGRDWYVVERDRRGYGYTIKGDVETIYPGLMKEIKGWETLTALAKKGPVDVTDIHHQQLLKDVGFQVVPSK